MGVETMSQPTSADLAIEQLIQDGVEVCFANPGTTEMWLVAALGKQKNIHSILGLHEAVCTGACDGYARIKRSPAMCLLHLGPGLGNGLCNLHNARRANSPVVVIVGDMATWHKGADPPLNQDIAALASTVSGAVLHISSPGTVCSILHEAIAATQQPTAAQNQLPAATAQSKQNLLQLADAPASNISASSNARGATTVNTAQPTRPAGCAGSSIATVIFPHDISWFPAPQLQTKSGTAATGSSNGGARLANSPAARQFMKDCAAALRAAPKGKVALYLGGTALLAEGGALATAGRIAAHLGAALLCDALPARIDRGAGMPHPRRLPYFPQEAKAELDKYEVLLLLDVKRPVAMFGYAGGPSKLLKHSDDVVWELDASWCVAEALQLLVDGLPGAAAVQAGINCGGVFAVPRTPPLPTGSLTAAALCQTISALQPAGAIIVDESLTSGGAYWDASKGCPPFSQLCLTGGAIGSGPPMATGAAVAAPDRQVINIQADGSAMYTLQALWTQAHEQLQVLTIVCVNNSYAILQVEAMRQRTGSSFLTTLSGPSIDWVALAKGMGVPAGRADSVQGLAQLMKEGLAQKGPFLIHAALVAG